MSGQLVTTGEIVPLKRTDEPLEEMTELPPLPLPLPLPPLPCGSGAPALVSEPAVGGTVLPALVSEPPVEGIELPVLLSEPLVEGVESPALESVDPVPGLEDESEGLVEGAGAGVALGDGEAANARTGTIAKRLTVRAKMAVLRVFFINNALITLILAG